MDSDFGNHGYFLFSDYYNNRLLTLTYGSGAGVAGNVGIGTTTPGQKLSVAGTIESTSGGFKFPDGTTQTTAGGGTSLWTTSGSNIYNANTGYVGIGTPTPGAKLDVAGDMQWSGTLLAGAVPWARLTGVPTFVGGSGTGNYLAKFTAGTTIGNSSIFDNGLVGIGTDIPGAKLDVNGSVKMNGFQMATGASSGYVLTSDGTGTGTWQAASGGGPTLPYEGSVDTDGAAFKITNTYNYGSSSAIRGVSTNFGVIGEADPYGTGVYGYGRSGVEGYGSAGGTGVLGYAEGSEGWGIWGQNFDGGYAGYFSGDVHVNGTLTALDKQFKIDHPVDPANKYLSHASVESSEMLTLYTGNVVLDSNGTAWIELPSWFEALNTDFRYHLTSVGAAAPGLYIADEMQNNQFRIAGGLAGLKVSWQVTAVRQDPYAKAHPLQVEQDKLSTEQGFYQNPELYGESETQGMSYAHGKHPSALRQTNK